MAFAQGRGNAWRTAALLGLLLAALQCWAASATTWTVGGATGWSTGVNYTAWVEGRTFVTGDILFFPYTQGTHDVLEVSEADYSSCTATSPIKSYSDGNSNVTLNATGNNYYICGVPGHCPAGMKLAIDVVAAASSPTPAPKTAPTPSPTPSPKTAPTPAPASRAPTPTPSPSSVSTPAPGPAPSSPAPAATSPTPSPSSVSTPASGPAPSTPPTTTPSPSIASATAPSSPSPGTPPAAATPPTTSSPPAPPPSSAQSLQVGAVVALVLGSTLLVL